MNCIATFARLSRSASGEKCRSYLALAPLATTGVAIASSAALTYEGSDQQPTERADNFTEVRLILNQTRFNRKNFNAVCEAPLATGKNETLTPKEHREETEEERFERVLAYHRSKIETYRSDWEYKAQNSGSSSSVSTATKTPSRTWPDGIPSNGDLSYLLEDLKYCVRSPNFRSDKEYCHKLSFRVAAALLQQFEEETQKRGFDLLKSLAEIGYPDAMVFYGMCLNDGRAGTDPNPEQAVVWFRRCADMYEHPQAQYELGVALYTGEGVVENEEEAIKWFRLASEQNHPAACYMLGDCLLDGSGVEMDRGAALEWLIRSSELGHRGARSRVMAVLEKKEGEDYGRFTDASRQTLKEHVLHSVDNQGRKIQRRATRRRSTSPRNPAELARRQTIVSNSRRDTVAKE